MRTKLVTGAERFWAYCTDQWRTCPPGFDRECWHYLGVLAAHVADLLDPIPTRQR